MGQLSNVWIRMKGIWSDVDHPIINGRIIYHHVRSEIKHKRDSL